MGPYADCGLNVGSDNRSRHGWMSTPRRGSERAAAEPGDRQGRPEAVGRASTHVWKTLDHVRRGLWPAGGAVVIGPGRILYTTFVSLTLRTAQHVTHRLAA